MLPLRHQQPSRIAPKYLYSKIALLPFTDFYVVLPNGAAILEFGPVDDPDQGLDVVEPGLPRIIPVGRDPVDHGRGGIEARLDAALLDRGLGDQFVDRRGPEVILDLGLQGQLIAFQGEQEIVRDDPVGDRDLAAHGVDRHQGAYELPCFGEVVEKLRDGGDLFSGTLSWASVSRAFVA